MKKLSIAIAFVCISLLFILNSCDKDDNDNDIKTISATVVYKSSSLASHKSTLNILTDSTSLTPYNIDGEALSLLFATASEEDEGLVIFGDGRPDIAPGNATFYPFDFANLLAVNSTVTLKPGYIGGLVQHMVTMFGYIDIYVDIDNHDRILRLALGEYSVGSNTYIRGDVLLQDTVTNIFMFYDLDNYLFTNARPTNPYVIEEIRDFFDPIRPNMVYYPLNVFLDPDIYLDAAELQTASSIYVEVDFSVEDFVILQNQSSTSGISDSAIINSFNITQNILGLGNSGLTATVDSLEIYQ